MRAGAGRAADDGPGPPTAALQQAHWRRLAALSSGVDRLEHFVAAAGFDRGPWLAVVFGAGIAAWFLLPGLWQWLALMAGGLAVAAAVLAFLSEEGRFPYIRQALAAAALALVAGCGTVWVKSALVGMPGIERPATGTFSGVVVSRQEQPAEKRTRLVVATRDPFKPGRIIQGASMFLPASMRLVRAKALPSAFAPG